MSIVRDLKLLCGKATAAEAKAIALALACRANDRSGIARRIPRAHVSGVCLETCCCGAPLSRVCLSHTRERRHCMSNRTRHSRDAQQQRRSAAAAVAAAAGWL